MANSSETAKEKEKGASEYQKQKQVVSDLLSSAESAWFALSATLLSS